MSDEERAAGIRARLAASAPPVRPAVWYRATGRHVQYLQRRLEIHKIYSVERGDDYGLFGAATEQAVRAFQSAHELRCDGIVDDDDWLALDQEP